MKLLFGATLDFVSEVLHYPVPSRVEELPGSIKKALLEHLSEETAELAGSGIKNDADALVDIIYLAAGGLMKMGFTPAQAAFAFKEVHRANMDKVNGKNAKRPHSSDYDAVKPDSWRGPDWDMILEYKEPAVRPLLETDKARFNLNEEAKTQTAEQLVMSREELYGSFKDRAETVDIMTDALEQHPNWKGKLQSNHRHALRMIVEKIGRILVGGDPSYADNWKDIQGYAKLAEKDQ